MFFLPKAGGGDASRRPLRVGLPHAVLLSLLLISARGLSLNAATASRPRVGRVPILYAPDASECERLAAREVRRYVYQCTGQLLPLRPAAEPSGGADGAIVVATKQRSLALGLADAGARKTLDALTPHEYWLKTFRPKCSSLLLLTGGDDVGTLYAAYRFAETLGVRFYLHGDTLPDTPQAFQLPALDERHAPLFELRGIQPFHDFPEGPDWWNADDYAAVLAQLAKLRMNFIGLHTYPDGGPNAEPTVWIGRPTNAAPNGVVTASYPASYQNTLRGNWGYTAKPTRAFLFGADQLFDQDAFGADVMIGRCPQPSTPAECNALFNDTAAMLNAAFTFAHRLGIKTCVGTETPLIVPRQLCERLRLAGEDPNDPAIVREFYRGIFRRAAAAYPLDYYWLWTPEGWTWEGTKDDQVRQTTNDLFLALAAARDVKAPFQIATCGWVLGPQQDRAMFDRVLPKTVALSCINRDVGRTPVDPGFARVSGRGKWAIPWMEDDPALTIPQLWVGRMRRDAGDARRYGCNGLMGIHWRTRVIAPNVVALAQAAWNQNSWNSDPFRPPSAPATNAFPAVTDFYVDWATREFGAEAGPAIAGIFARLDGRLPRPADWVDGPGGIRPDPRAWEQVSPEYAFVAEFEAIEPRIRGAGNRARFGYWLETFRYQRAMARLNCTWAAFNQALAKARDAQRPGLRQLIAAETALPLRCEIVQQLRTVYSHLLATVGTPGELGTVANWDQHLVPTLLTRPGEELAKLLGTDLPAQAVPDQAYTGPLRVIVPTVRTTLEAGAALDLKVIVLASARPKEAVLRWRHLGGSAWQRVPVLHVERGVHKVRIPEAAATDDFEYYIEIRGADGRSAFFPPTAPNLNQSVVLISP